MQFHKLDRSFDIKDKLFKSVYVQTLIMHLDRIIFATLSQTIPRRTNCRSLLLFLNLYHRRSSRYISDFIGYKFAVTVIYFN